MRVAIIGAGYVGLVTGACLAEFGHRVSCVEADAERLATLEAGGIPIFEPGLAGLVARNVAAGRLVFTGALPLAVADAEIVMIAVGTPARHGDGGADLGQVYEAARLVAPAVRDGAVVVVKSTVPVGTGDDVERIIRSGAPDRSVHIVSNPEFLREGAAIEDFKHPDRIVVGAESDPAREAMAELYRPLMLSPSPLLFVSRRTAELTKYAANSFLAMKVTFINQISDLSEAVGADALEVARGIGLDPRIGDKYLNPGPGYGGSCLPKDTVALIRTAADAGARVTLVEATVDANEARKHGMARRVALALGGEVEGRTAAILGLTFKANTDDLRDAVSLELVAALTAAGAHVRAYDPEGMAAAHAIFPDLTYCSDAYDAASGADVLVIATEWEAFRALDFERLGKIMSHRLVVDLRNLYWPQDVARYGFTYHSLGRTVARPSGRASLKAVGNGS
ncbi:MAG TPA: UDP-glucose/GDP-mannose dehydrogenase family protein [Devosia sp.]|nr:UDP-glucose/GDP-mannose dehydrogenase family protein [Devosia sp.]